MKKLISILLLISITLSSLASCGTADNVPDPPSDEGVGDNATPDGSGTNDGDKDYIYSEDIHPTLIMSESLPKTEQTVIYQGIKSAYGFAPAYDFDTELEEDSHEIVIGPTNRDISALAYAELEKISKADDYTVRYLYYAKDGSVAVAYDEDFDNVGVKLSCADFVTRVLGNNKELSLEDGIVYSASVSVLDYLDALDSEYYSSKWESYEKLIGKEPTEAFRSLFESYDPAVIDWLLALYDPVIGGFYYSNSARDNAGYGPDAETTNQALNYFGNIASIKGIDYPDILPESMKAEIVNYIKSLQYTDGYFYNYQWTRAKAHTNRERMARDLSYSLNVLSALGSAPTYDTPTGLEGDGIVCVGNYTRVPEASLKSSAAVAVSRVIAAAAYPEYYESIETAIEYLEEKRLRGTSFYVIGSQLNSESSQLLARDRDLEEAFRNDPANAGKQYVSIADSIIDWLNLHQNPENGTWSTKNNYDAVNGLLKTGGFYNAVGRELPYAEVAAMTALDSIGYDEDLYGIVELYNPWGAIALIIKNLRNYGSTVTVDGVEKSGAKRAAELLDTVRRSSKNAILHTIEKVKLFAKPDGSFSYCQKYPSPTSNGMPVCVPYTFEGDVNGTVLASTGLIVNITNALETPTVRIFGRRELRILVTKLDKMIEEYENTK